MAFGPYARPMLRILFVFSLLVWTMPPAPAAAVQDGGAPHVPEATPATADAGAVSSALATLRNDLERLIRSPGWRGDRWSVIVVSLTRGDTLFDHSADESVAPASNLKLFTTAAGLYYLGPDFRYNTFLMTDGRIANGVLTGNVVLYGTGDPTLSTRFGRPLTVWEAFADTLAALGVTEVRGDIVGDGTYFTGPGTGEGWQTSYMNASYAAPASALSFAENIVMLQIAPGDRAGWRPEVQAIPGGDAIAVVNQATTVAGGRTSIRVTRAAYDGPILVQGQIARGQRPILRSVPASDPPQYAAAALHQVLVERGIPVTGLVRTVEAPSASPVTARSVFAPALRKEQPLRVLAIHTSPPLIEILDIINRRSHNMMAEQVLRTVGRVALGEGSVTAGAEAVRSMLDSEIEAPAAGVVMYDGSGLSTLNRSSARGIVQLLSFVARSPLWNAYWSTLPEAGSSRDGLRRMGRTPADGNLRAKTGTINRVSALSGYVRARNNEVLAFSIISNNVPSTWRAKRVEDAIGARLAAFDRPLTVVEVATTTPPAPAEAPATPPAAQPAVAERRPSGTSEHEIQRGETLDAIAQRYGTTVAALQRANPGLDPRRLIPGRTVRLPATSESTPDRAPAATPPRPPARQREHTIRAGDTLDEIARRYGTSVEALRTANPGLSARRLIPGRTVKLPPTAATERATAEAAVSPPAATRPREHTIRAGDTLEGIARQHGTSVEALRAANPGLNPRRLIPGRSIKLPSS